MNEFIGDDKIEAIRNLYEESEVAQRFLDWAAGRQRDATETSVDRAALVARAAPGDVRTLFRALEKIGVGAMIQGRKGYKTRFSWDFSLSSIGKVSKRQAAALADIDIDTAEPPEDPSLAGQAESLGTDDRAGMIGHVFQLRAGLSVTVPLPPDLTAKEAERIAAWVRTLPFE